MAKKTLSLTLESEQVEAIQNAFGEDVATRLSDEQLLAIVKVATGSWVDALIIAQVHSRDGAIAAVWFPDFSVHHSLLAIGSV